MKQSKNQSVIESLTNVVVGLLTSFGIQRIMFPLLSIDVSINQNIIITGVYFVVSFLRGYLIRRLFNKPTYKEENEPKEEKATTKAMLKNVHYNSRLN